ncbi:MAG: T9SS type A sorting domain-containing protein [Bacteroidota bacterium]
MSRLTTTLNAAGLLLAAVLGGLWSLPGAAAQSVAVQSALGPAPVRWDSLGGDPDRFGMDGLAVRPTLYGDTLFASNNGELYRLLPDEGTFGPQINEGFNPRPEESIAITDEGHFISNGFKVSYSTDGGVTWLRANAAESVSEVYQTRHPANEGRALAAGRAGAVWVSEDGTAWDTLFNFGSTGFRTVELVYDLLGGDDQAAPWAGRLLAGFIGVVRYSDDGGTTWRDAEGFPFLMPRSVAEGPDGTVYLTADRYMFRSRDGGASWEEVHEFSLAEWMVDQHFGGHIAVARDGTVWIGMRGRRDGVRWGTFAYSVDEGATWTEAADGYGSYRVNAVLIDGRGRLVAATEGGVWRTAAGVSVAVEESVPEGKGGEGLGAVYPNPAGGAVTVPVTLAEGTEVTVVVYDVLGRAVATVARGRVEAGAHAFGLDTAELAPGVYVVRLDAGSTTATQRFTVVR